MILSTPAEKVADLVTFASMAEDLVHQHLNFATDHDGRPAVIVPPSAADQLHTLVREIARRARELEVQL
ncbi:hypothetical protein ACRQ1B_03260 [Rhizobium panacihumi]|uniref:hypothetical protein n=1 Tax=Rhizobium panacihumi TaxID=2008450 RepID=UPI003D78D107